MKAKEMFVRLGYKYTDYENYVEVECSYRDIDSWKRIVFDKSLRRFQAFENNGALEVDVKTLAAICQQVKELGWLEE